VRPGLRLGVLDVISLELRATDSGWEARIGKFARLNTSREAAERLVLADWLEDARNRALNLGIEHVPGLELTLVFLDQAALDDTLGDLERVNGQRSRGLDLCTCGAARAAHFADGPGPNGCPKWFPHPQPRGTS